MIEGKNVELDQALAMGLVNKVWATETHDAFVRKIIDYAHDLAPPNKASRAVGAIKRAVQSGGEMSLEHGLALERELQQALFNSDDAKEGLAAFTQKRKPSFRGR